MTEVLRGGARAPLTQAVEAEVAEFLAKYADLRTATGHLRVVRHGEIWLAETKDDAITALETFVETCQVKYKKAADCLTKDRDALLAFYDFPAEHWKHLRTTYPIESTFATVRHRTIRSRGCLSNKTALAMVFKPVEGAQKSWCRIDGHNQLPKLIQGVKFADGIEIVGNSAAPQAQAAA